MTAAAAAAVCASLKALKDCRCCSIDGGTGEDTFLEGGREGGRPDRPAGGGRREDAEDGVGFDGVSSFVSCIVSGIARAALGESNLESPPPAPVSLLPSPSPAAKWLLACARLASASRFLY